MDFSKIVGIAVTAGKAVLRIYEQSEGIVIERKADNSPLTQADRESHKIIVAGLKELGSDLPIVSEEGKHIPYLTRRAWDTFWLVDPLDGTKEFIGHRDEFTVNVALIENGEPVDTTGVKLRVIAPT